MSAQATVVGIDHIPTEEDWECLVQKARDLESRIHSVQDKQNDYNAMLERCYVVEEAQRIRMEELRSQVRDEEIQSLSNPAFATWMKSQEESMATDLDAISTWFHDDRLLSLTPFAAVVPFPRQLTLEGRRLCEDTLNSFQLSHFYVQTVPVKTALATLASDILPESPLTGEESSVPYIAVPVKNGAAALDLIASNVTLSEGLKETSCLLVNDRRLSAHLCFKCLIVRGCCIAAEVASTSALLPVFQTGADSDEKLSPLDVTAYAIKRFVAAALTPILQSRTYEALIVASVPLTKQPLSLEMADYTFQVLNIDYPDTSHFSMFSAEDLRSISGYVSRKQQRQQDAQLPPALRLVERSSPRTATVAMAVRQIEKGVERYHRVYKELLPVPSGTAASDTASSPSQSLENSQSISQPEAAPYTGGTAPCARLSAAHMDPFLSLPATAATLSRERFFAEAESIEKMLNDIERGVKGSSDSQ